MGYFARRQERRERRVIAAMQPPGSRHYLLDLMRLLRMNAGTAYLTMARLEASGVVASGWESEHGPRPRRRLYWLTTKAPS